MYRLNSNVCLVFLLIWLFGVVQQRDFAVNSLSVPTGSSGSEISDSGEENVCNNETHTNASGKVRSFSIDYGNNTFLKDGEPFRYVSGSVHYFRVMESYWDGILRKLRLAGLNAVQTYVEWSSHQPTSAAQFNFDGNLNLFKFLEVAQKNDLLVILRTGPFMDAERDMGGFPPWLLFQKKEMKLRTSDLEYVYFVSRWFDHLLPRLKPYLYENGGPVIMIQVENEYGSYGCDKNYTSFLRDLIRLHLGDEVLLFTTDGAGDSYLKCGAVPETYPTVDFGTASSASVLSYFVSQRHFAPQGPLVNSEYYPGWLDHWNAPHSTVSVSATASTLRSMLELNANVNIYMFYGGTSFGYGAGSNADSSAFLPCPTSYDYDAPLNEAGDPTPKYYAIKDIISHFMPVPRENPQVSEKSAVGKISLTPCAHILIPRFLSIFGPRARAKLPSSFESLKIGSGFVLYETTVKFLTTDPAVLSAPELKDRAYIFVDSEFAGVLSRQEKIKSLPIFSRKGSSLQILVENQGRPCYGSLIGESKGLGEVVTLGGKALQNWTMYKLGPMEGSTLTKYAQTILSSHPNKDKDGEVSADYEELALKNGGAGSFYHGNFTITNTTILDTFVRLDGWTKGIVWVNGFNLGRYWRVGPQETLYLPAPLLKSGRNSIVIFELERAPRAKSELYITLTDKHVINGTTPDSDSGSDSFSAIKASHLKLKYQKHVHFEPEDKMFLQVQSEKGNGNETETIAVPNPSLTAVVGQPEIKFRSDVGLQIQN